MTAKKLVVSLQTGRFSPMSSEGKSQLQTRQKKSTEGTVSGFLLLFRGGERLRSVE
nr:MAG TPA: Protein of unknown function (DUF3055) [Caudoviricetes sp.]